MANMPNLIEKLKRMAREGTPHERRVAAAKLRALRRSRGVGAVAYSPEKGELTVEQVFSADDSMYGPTEEDSTRNMVYPAGRRRR